MSNIPNDNNNIVIDTCEIKKLPTLKSVKTIIVYHYIINIFFIFFLISCWKIASRVIHFYESSFEGNNNKGCRCEVEKTSCQRAHCNVDLNEFTEILDVVSLSFVWFVFFFSTKHTYTYNKCFQIITCAIRRKS